VAKSPPPTKKGWTFFSFWRAVPDSGARGAPGTARQNDKEVHPPFFLAAAISPLSLFFKKYFAFFFLK
jgi:hypothetical protein